MHLTQTKRRSSTLISIIIAGEAVFFLPFVMARIFRPTLLQVFEISNTELGVYYSLYGITALISYLMGGRLADRFPARNLMSIALWMTSLGGFVMASLPSSLVIKILYVFWGFTTILIFWAVMIRATREWGGPGFQGRAFGWLEGGRGGTAALIGTIAFFLFSYYSGESPEGDIAGRGIHAFQIVIIVISAITFGSGILVWFVVPRTSVLESREEKLFNTRSIYRLVRMPTIWLLSIMIICAYAGYKITDDFSLYAREVLGYSEVWAAGVGTGALWIRAVIAIMAGYIGDRVNQFKVLIVFFSISACCGILTGTGIMAGMPVIALLNISLAAAGIYGVRALYFSVMKQAGVPLADTGTAVGVVSLVGFTPEIFMSPWMGHLLDKNPGDTGHQYVFLVLSLFAIIGLLNSLVFMIIDRKRRFDSGNT